MDFSLWDTAILGGLGIVLFIVLRRLLRRGLSTQAQSRAAMEKRIRKTSAEIHESNLFMSAEERLDLMEAALREILALEGNPQGCSLERRAGGILLRAPWGARRIVHRIHTASPRGMRRPSRGEERWEVWEESGAGARDEPRRKAAPRVFPDLAAMMRHMDALVRFGGRLSEEGEEAGTPELRRHLTRGRGPRAAS